GRHKRAIEDHFDTAYEIESDLEAKGKHALLEVVQGVLPPGCRCIYTRQPEPLGLGHAVLCAQPVVGNEPFAVLLADDLIDAEPSVTAQMARRFATEGCSILGVMEVPRERTASYGIVSTEHPDAELSSIRAMVEKPKPENAPSTLAVVGRYVLTPRIFDKLAAVRPGSGGEIQLTDGIAALLHDERVMAYRFAGRRFDCGSKLGYLQATVELGLKHAEVGAGFSRYLADRARA
ncbi:MAG: UTP--glucose-1-phosphate uridylyltransferase, partial [Betaproteobacteria bacterium]|nr:UTP--glucose-1-phosphate uridylyltransferase [Betaproteobacteria bacterium]